MSLNLKYVKVGDLVQLVAQSDAYSNRIKRQMASVEKITNRIYLFALRNSLRNLSFSNVIFDVKSYGKDWYLENIE